MCIFIYVCPCLTHHPDQDNPAGSRPPLPSGHLPLPDHRDAWLSFMYGLMCARVSV